MKRILCMAILGAALVVFGCAKPTPEDAAKDYAKELFKPNYGAKMDMSKLEYNITKEGDDQVAVKISGPIYYEETIILSKVDGKWQIKGESAPVTPADQVPTH